MSREGVGGVVGEEILNAERAAELLRVSTHTVCALARRGEVPARKVGREWRFSRRALLDWLAGPRGAGR